MKKIALLAFVVLISSCKKKTSEYSITATAEGFEEGTEVYINGISQSNRPFVIDTAVIEKGKFQIKLPPSESYDFNYINFKNVNGNLLYIAENHPIQMTIFKDSINSSIVKGGPDNESFFTYIKKIRAFGDEKVKLNTQYKIASSLKESEKIQAIFARQKTLAEEEKQFRLSTANNNPNTIVGILALGDVMNMKILPPNEIKEKFNSLTDTLKNSRLGKDLFARIGNAIARASEKRIDIGSVAEDFSAPTPEGKTLSLKKSLGKITILDFWASWCKPCRMENPNVVKVYNKYHNKGLNIIGVSLDRKQEAWVKAIDDDNLTWNHVSNLKFWQEPIARAYGVRSIPATFILDENGNVIAKNLRGPALEQKISELLGEAL